jgi:hypothetical protein
MNIEENGVSRKMTVDDIPKLEDALRSSNWYGFRRWINVITSDEGCTSADARKLREYNHGLSDENARLREALREALDGAAYTVSVDALLNPNIRHAGLEMLARHRSLLPDAVDVCPDAALPNVV